MARKKVEITDFKTKRIGKFTGGQIGTHDIPDYPKTKDDDGRLSNSFLSKKGVYIGDYARGWWYFKNSLLVSEDYPHGLAILLIDRADKIEGLDVENPDPKHIKGYYGYSHRGGNTFAVGDRIFDASYEPKEEDYTKEEWAKFKADREEAIQKNLKDGWCENREEAEKETSLRDVIPFRKRGYIKIETHEQAKQSAINLSKDLS